MKLHFSDIFLAGASIFAMFAGTKKKQRSKLSDLLVLITGVLIVIRSIVALIDAISGTVEYTASLDD
jgi:predicted tellurium resistance membrane protein TerC